MPPQNGKKNGRLGQKKKRKHDDIEEQKKRAIRIFNKKYQREMEPSNNIKEKKKKIQEKQDKNKESTGVLITDDVDFAPDDYDGRIARYQQRIKEGYSKYTFELKIAEMKAAKQAKADAMAQYPGKSWDVVQRIQSLKQIEQFLVQKKDPCRELPNVKAIIAAYQRGELEWNDKTTYWGQGRMIAEPYKFSWADFRKFNTAENRGDGGFWVEGKYPMGNSRNRRAFLYHAPGIDDGHTTAAVEVKHQVRLDYNCGNFDTAGAAFPVLDLTFIDDTGSDTMLIFDTDMKNMMGGDATPDMPAPYKHLMGYTIATMADGSRQVEKNIALQVNMTGTNVDTGATGDMVPDWKTIVCAVSEPGIVLGQGVRRLNGPWARSMLFVGSAPEAPIAFYASSTKSGLLGRQGIPAIPYTAIEGPNFQRPDYGATWTFDQARNLWTVTALTAGRGAMPGEVQGSLDSSGSDTEREGEGEDEGEDEDEGDELDID